MEDKLYLNKEWLKGQFDLYKKPTYVAKKTGYSRTVITRHAIEFGIYKSKFNRNAKNNVNEDYFKIIDSADKAYFLGFIMADGNIYRYENERLQFSIKIKRDDEDILIKLCNAISFDVEKLYRRCSRRNNTITHSTEVKIYNSNFCQNLIRLGVIPSKTGKEFIPDCNGYEKDFIRGFLDGDGWIGKDRVRIGWCSKSFKILEQIKEYLNSLDVKVNINDQKDVYVINLYHKEKVLKVLKNIYYEDCISLNRKKELALKTINDIEKMLFGSL